MFGFVCLFGGTKISSSINFRSEKGSALTELEPSKSFFSTSTMHFILLFASTAVLGSNEFGLKFLEENKVREGVITLDSGLQYKVLRVRLMYRHTIIEHNFVSTFTSSFPIDAALVSAFCCSVDRFYR